MSSLIFCLSRLSSRHRGCCRDVSSTRNLLNIVMQAEKRFVGCVSNLNQREEGLKEKLDVWHGIMVSLMYRSCASVKRDEVTHQ